MELDIQLLPFRQTGRLWGGAAEGMQATAKLAGIEVVTGEMAMIDLTLRFTVESTSSSSIFVSVPVVTGIGK